MIVKGYLVDKPNKPKLKNLKPETKCVLRNTTKQIFLSDILYVHTYMQQLVFLPRNQVVVLIKTG